MKMFFFRIAALLLLSTMCIAVRAEVRYKELSPLYEIKSCDGTGEFIMAHAFSLDERDGTISVLAGPPLSVCVYDAMNGYQLRSFKVERDTAPPMAIWKCGGPTMLIDRNGAAAFGDDSRPIADFAPPAGIATSTVKVVCAPGGGVFSLDAKTGLVHRFDAKDNLTQTIPGKEIAAKCCGKGRGVPVRAYDFAPEPSGGVFVLDAKYARVLKFDYNGNFRKVAAGETRMEDGPILQTPTLIATDPRGNVWLYDSADRAIKVYDSFGYLRHAFIDTTSAGFAFISPAAMSIDRFGRLFMLDSTNNSIRVFDVAGVN